MAFKRAERKQVKLKLALTGPSGSGKTYSALLIASGLGKKIAVLDTENDSAQLYAGSLGIPEFDSQTIQAPFLTSKYSAIIKDAVKEKYDVLIIDSISHQWSGEGGIMDRIDKEKLAKPGANSYTMWAKFTPEHEQFKQAIIQAPIHIIATIRSKQDYSLDKDDRGKSQVTKLGMAPVQRESLEYEFTTVLDLSMKHYATASKDRSSLFDDLSFKPSAETGQIFLNWLNQGNEYVPPEERSAGEPNSYNKFNSVTLTQAQAERFYIIVNKAGWTKEDAKKFILKKFGIESALEMKRDDYEGVCEFIEAHPKAAIETGLPPVGSYDPGFADREPGQEG